MRNLVVATMMVGCSASTGEVDDRETAPTDSFGKVDTGGSGGGLPLHDGGSFGGDSSSSGGSPSDGGNPGLPTGGVDSSGGTDTGGTHSGGQPLSGGSGGGLVGGTGGETSTGGVSGGSGGSVGTGGQVVDCGDPCAATEGVFDGENVVQQPICGPVIDDCDETVYCGECVAPDCSQDPIYPAYWNNHSCDDPDLPHKWHCADLRLVKFTPYCEVAFEVINPILNPGSPHTVMEGVVCCE